ncbi:MAG: hypothetical protein LBD89_01270 [Tannerellaceae bacterium]|jgi:hypothetical protein|nr:hypothetical protein [Tannerellaceae bacterium]
MKAFYLIPVLALLFLAGCTDNNNEEDIEIIEEEIEIISDPSQHILGQWQEIARGNEMYPEVEPNWDEIFPELVPDGHILEFLADGTMLGRTYHRTVWIGILPETIHSDSYRLDTDFLYINDGKFPDGYTYQYSFTGANTLRLDYVNGAIIKIMGTPKFHIYERLTTQEK